MDAQRRRVPQVALMQLQQAEDLLTICSRLWSCTATPCRRLLRPTVLGIAKDIVEDCAVSALLVYYVVPATAELSIDVMDVEVPKESEVSYEWEELHVHCLLWTLVQQDVTEVEFPAFCENIS